MSEKVVTIEDAARCLTELVEWVHSRSEAALLVKAGQPLAHRAGQCSRPSERADRVFAPVAYPASGAR